MRNLHWLEMIASDVFVDSLPTFKKKKKKNPGILFPLAVYHTWSWHFCLEFSIELENGQRR